MIRLPLRSSSHSGQQQLKYQEAEEKAPSPLNKAAINGLIRLSAKLQDQEFTDTRKQGEGRPRFAHI